MSQMKCLICFVLLFSGTTNASAQISIGNIPEIANLKEGTTYVVMNNPSSAKAAPYVKAFNEIWSISKLVFITPAEMANHYAPGNFFFSMSGDVFHSYSDKRIYSYSNTHLYLELWTPDEKFLKSKKKDKSPNFRDKIELARIELYTDFEALKKPAFLFESDYDGGGHIRNWGPGIFKNYLQTVTSLLMKGEKRGLSQSVRNKEKMAQLAAATLYVPEYVLIKFNMFSGDETGRHDEKEMMEDYGFKYKLVSDKILNENILTDKKGFYYLAYVKSSTFKFVSVLHSLTGEIIYSEFTSGKYNLKSGDLKNLYKEIN